MPLPGEPHRGAEIAAEVEAIQARLAALTRDWRPAHVASELDAIRDHLRRLAQDNEEVRRRMGSTLGLTTEDVSPAT